MGLHAVSATEPRRLPHESQQCLHNRVQPSAGCPREGDRRTATEDGHGWTDDACAAASGVGAPCPCPCPDLSSRSMKNHWRGCCREFSDSGWVLRPDPPRGASRLQTPGCVHFSRRGTMHVSVLLVCEARWCGVAGILPVNAAAGRLTARQRGRQKLVSPYKHSTNRGPASKSLAFHFPPPSRAGAMVLTCTWPRPGGVLLVSSLDQNPSFSPGLPGQPWPGAAPLRGRAGRRVLKRAPPGLGDSGGLGRPWAPANT